MSTSIVPDAAQGAAVSRPVGEKLRWRAVAGVVLGLAALLALFAGGMVLIPRYQAANPPTALQRSDANQVRLDDLFLDVTLVTPRFLESRKLERYLAGRNAARVLPVLVGLNTHTGDIGHLHHLPGQLFLVGPDGRRYPSITEPIVVSQHHNAYLLLFPARDQLGHVFLEQKKGVLAMEAVGMGRTPLRRFEWKLPLPEEVAPSSSASLAAQMMLMMALLSALLVVLSPCALELTLYYTAIISCTVTDGERVAARTHGKDAARAGRKKLLVNLSSFLMGFTLLYAASGATVGLIGQGVREPLGEYGDLIRLLGGAIILLFSLRVAGVDRWMISKLKGMRTSSTPAAVDPGRIGLLGKLARGLTLLRRRAQTRASTGHVMRARDSFLVGMGLSSSCVSCMGGAVLYPLLVYAGITSWYSGLITLGLYSLAIAVPMLFIALGFFRIRMSLKQRIGVNRWLRMTSATMLAGIGLLIVSGYERIFTDMAFRLLAEVSRWSA